ncbi:MAG: PQQ-binding-like beta-propeller repeat protein [Bacteroidota bacterium]|nr:PQQ-binding-like beta-propeller repeat protein [Bacteroidota bacterium]
MKLRNTLSTAVLLFSLAFTQAYGQVKPERQWPGYRGYLASGVLDNANLPETFDFQKSVNILWKVSIPGMGISSPSIWGNRLFITTAVSEGDKAGFKPGLYGDVTPVKDSSIHEWKVYCIDKKSGKVIWERTAYKGIPKVKRHPKSTHANSTIATDGKHVVAFFGSEGLYCYNYDGKLLWQKNFGLLRSAFFVMKNAEWEFASSPLIYDGSVVIQCDVLENSFLAAYDAETGKELWKVSRDEYPGWCTPNIYTNAGKTCVAVNGYKHRGGYDFKTGKEIWNMSGGGDIPIPTPVLGDNVIFFNSAHGKYSPIMAVKTNATGDITLKENETSNSGVLWSMPRGGSYIQTMLLYRNHLYSLNWNGTIQCLDPATGKEIYNAKLGASKSFMASPVASDGKIYIIDETGTVYILEDGETFKLLAEIPTNEISLTAPAITDGIIFFRTQNYLYAAGKK